jgi:hypothetical protein
MVQIITVRATERLGLECGDTPRASGWLDDAGDFSSISIFLHGKPLQRHAVVKLETILGE